MVGVVILNYNDFAQTINCAEGILALPRETIVVVVDNHSDNDSFIRLQKRLEGRCVLIESDRNGGYGAGNNIGLRWLREHTDAVCAVVCNPDAGFDANFLDAVCDAFDADPRLGAVSGLMVNAEGVRSDVSYWRRPGYWADVRKCFLGMNYLCRKREVRSQRRREASLVCELCGERPQDTVAAAEDEGRIPGGDFLEAVPSGACVALRLAALEKAGYYDEGNFLYYEENMLAARMESCGYRCGVLTEISFRHLESTTISSVFSREKKHLIYYEAMRYYEKHYNGIGRFRERFLRLCCYWGHLEYCLLLRLGMQI